MTTPASDNRFKGVSFQPQTTPSTPITGDGRLFLDTADGLLKWIDDAGTVNQVSLGAVSGAVATDAIWDAKGDLAAGTGANTASKLTVGSNDTVLMADSAQTTGLKWVASQTPSTQAFGDSAAEGTADTYARGDHKHAMPASPAGSILEQHAAASSATLDFTSFISGSFKAYEFVFLNVIPATNNVTLNLTMGTGAGPSWDNTTGHYSWGGLYYVNNASAGQGSDSTTVIGVALSVSSTTATGGVSGRLVVSDPSNTSINKLTSSLMNCAVINNSGKMSVQSYSGSFLQTTAVTGVRFAFSSGNIASGTIYVRGIV